MQFALLSSFAACAPALPEGRFECESSSQCPSGWTCAADRRCYSQPNIDAGARDDDENPNRDQVNRTEAVLARLGKRFQFHRYDGAGHAFFNAARVAYRPEQALDGWAKVFAFFHQHLATPAVARAG